LQAIFLTVFVPTQLLILGFALFDQYGEEVLPVLIGHFPLFLSLHSTIEGLMQNIKGHETLDENNVGA